MNYRTADALRDALEQRLRSDARANGVTLVRLRKRVVFERFLARLEAAAPDRWVLKGAVALDLRLGLRTRTTRDIDLGRTDDERAATADLVMAAALDLGDFFVFRTRRTPALDETAGFLAIRYTVTSDLAGRRFEQFPIDVAFAEPPLLEVERLQAPGALAFADVDPPQLPVVALEQHIAEKLHAYTATYGAARHESTRSKDLVDLVLIAASASPDAGRLGQALRSTFERRTRQPLPTSVPRPPESWAVPYAAQAAEVGLPTGLRAAHSAAGALLDPILCGLAVGGWNPERTRWDERC